MHWLRCVGGFGKADRLPECRLCESGRGLLRSSLPCNAPALQALKPCFMMGPLRSLSTFQRGRLKFDLVIFDEASQIRPELVIVWDLPVPGGL